VLADTRIVFHYFHLLGMETAILRRRVIVTRAG